MKRNKAKKPIDPGAKYAIQLDKTDKAERKMRRAFRAWEKERDKLGRIGKQLDAAFAGKADVAELAELKPGARACEGVNAIINTMMGGTANRR